MSADIGNQPKFDMAAYLRRHLGPLPIVSATRFVSAKSIREDDDACDDDLINAEAPVEQSELQAAE